MPKTRTNVYKRKDGRWEGRFVKERKEGRAIYSSVYAHTYHEVCEKLNDAEKKIIPETKKSETGTVFDVGEEWLEEKSNFVKQSTLNKYEDLLRCYINPVFGHYKLSEITNRQIIDFGNSLLASGGDKKQGLCASTVMEVMSALNGLRLFALKRDYTVSYTTECFEIKREIRDIRVFSKEEEDTLIRWLCGHYSLTALGILLCLFTGIRIGEVCAITWSDFDFFAGVIHITKTMQRMRIKGSADRKTEVRILEPKSECSKRTIPIPGNLVTLFPNERNSEAFILTGKREAFVEPRTMENRFKSILRKAGIDDANFHATRHTFATRCVEQGFDVKCLSEILGHAGVSITLNRYIHPSIDLKTENMAKLTDMYPIKNMTT